MINEQIRDREVRLIGEDGEHLTKVGHKKLSERVTSQVFSLSKFNNLSL